MDDLTRRLERIEEQALAMGKDVVEVKVTLGAMNGSIANVLAELGDAPNYRFRLDRPTIHNRLRLLENDTAAAVAARAALRSADESRRRSWSLLEKLFLFAFVGTGTVTTLLRAFGWA